MPRDHDSHGILGRNGSNGFKRWYLIHKWTSLICTLFMLLLCLTGLPLVFHHELSHLSGAKIAAPALPADLPPANLDIVVDAALAARPGETIQYLIWEDDEPGTVTAVMASRPDTPPDDTQNVILDARTAQVLGQPAFTGSVLFVLLKLHTDMFAGLPGKLFLGAMGVIFLASILSGVLVYGPLMRKLPFGTIRQGRAPRIRWLDLHNLLGIATLAWATVVGTTGAISTLADITLQAWRNEQVAQMPKGRIASPTSSLQSAYSHAKAILPRMTPSFVAFPGTAFSSHRHYAFFMRGDKPLTSRLLKPVLIDAQTSQASERREPPWYMTLMLLAQPLHFGDYGGMPMKILWAILGIVTIVVLGSGLYLWVGRHRAAKQRAGLISRGTGRDAPTPNRCIENNQETGSNEVQPAKR